MALFIGSTIVVLCMVSLAHTCWQDLGDDLDPKLLGYVAKRNPYGSFAISGHSLVTPLEMLVYAAEGETRRQIAKALRMKPGQEVIPKESLCKSDVHTIGNYTEASKLFLGKQYEHNEIYEEEIKKVLDSEVGTVDFHNRTAAAHTINKWIYDNTHHKINDLVSPFDFDRNTTAVIANAFLIASQWLTPFDVHYTKDKDFYIPEQIPFMRKFDVLLVRELDDMDATAVYLPLKDVRGNMVLILPKKVDGLQRVLASLSRDENLKGLAFEQWVDLRLPKFEIDTYLELTDFLKSIGVVDVFTNKSELPNLTKEGTKVHISEFIQNSRIQIDEKGVNAATANDNVVDPTKHKPKLSLESASSKFVWPLVMNFNHPFYYGFTEGHKNEKIYFGGVFRG